jgi:hypothetical protein
MPLKQSASDNLYKGPASNLSCLDFWRATTSNTQYTWSVKNLCLSTIAVCLCQGRGR